MIRYLLLIACSMATIITSLPTQGYTSFMTERGEVSEGDNGYGGFVFGPTAIFLVPEHDAASDITPVLPVSNNSTCEGPKLYQWNIPCVENKRESRYKNICKIVLDGDLNQVAGRIPDEVYCSSCDHIVAIDKKTAISKYLCTLKQSYESDNYEIYKANKQLRTNLISAYLQDISFDEFFKVFQGVAAMRYTIDKYQVFAAFHSDFTPKFEDYLMDIVIGRTHSEYFGKSNFFYSYKFEDLIATMLWQSPNAFGNKISLNLNFNKLQNLREAIIHPSESEYKRHLIYRSVVLNEYYIRKLFQWVIQTERSEFEVVALKRYYKNKVKLVQNDITDFRKKVDNLEMEISAKKQLIIDFESAVGADNVDTINFLFDKLIQILNSKSKFAAKFFEDEINSILTKQPSSQIIQAYSAILNLQGDQLNSVINKVITGDSLNSLMPLTRNIIAGNIINTVKLRVSSLSDIFTSASSNLQDKNVNLADKIMEKLNFYNADVFLFAFNDNAGVDVENREVLFRLLSIFNDKVITPFIAAGTTATSNLNTFAHSQLR